MTTTSTNKVNPSLIITAAITLWLYCTMLWVGAQNSNNPSASILSKLPNDSSKVQTLLLLSEELRVQNAPTSVQYAKDALEIARQIKEPYWIGKSMIQMAWLEGQIGSYKDAMDMLASADSLLSAKKLTTLYPELLLAKGRVQFEKHFLPESLQNYLDALRLFEIQGDSMGVARSAAHAGSLHFFSGDYDISQHFLIRAEKIARAGNNITLLTQILSDMGNNYALWQKFDTSNQLLMDALALAEKNGNYGSKAKIYTNLAMNYYDQKLYDSAVYFFNMAYINDSIWGNPTGIIYATINLAAGYKVLKNLPKALSTAMGALERARTLGDRHLLKTILEDIADIYADMGDYTKAYAYQVAFNEVKDSVFNEKNATTIADMQARYEVEKKEKSLLLLQAQQRQKNTLIYGLSALTLLLLVSGTLLYRLQQGKIRQTAEKLTLQEQQLAGFASNLLQKDELIEDITAELNALKTDNNQQRLEQFQALLNARVSTEEDWMLFKTRFELLHPDFFARLAVKFPQLTPTEVKMCALEKLGLKDSQAGDLLGVNPESIRKGRYRLRKNLGDATWDELKHFIAKS
jgi:tetratricopeptide (TPR) repeat protein